MKRLALALGLTLSACAGTSVTPPHFTPGALLAPAPSVVFRTADWDAEFAPERGGQLLRLRHMPSARDILHYPATPEDYAAQPERHGIPVLFPPNRIDAGRFSRGGRDYVFPINDRPNNNHIHGIVIDVPWEIAADSAGPDTVTLSFRHDDSRQSFAGYPHRFILRITYAFHRDSVRQHITLDNLDEPDAPPMPYGLGFHTAFRLPVSDDNPPTLRVAAADHFWEIDPRRRFPTGRLLPWSADERYHTPEGQPIDARRAVSRHFPAAEGLLDGAPFRGAILDLPTDGLRITYEVGDAFDHWYLWRPPDDPAVLCVEPMTWVANAPNLPLPDAQTGLRYLAPGARWQTWARITVTPLHP